MPKKMRRLWPPPLDGGRPRPNAPDIETARLWLFGYASAMRRRFSSTGTSTNNADMDGLKLHRDLHKKGPWLTVHIQYLLDTKTGEYKRTFTMNKADDKHLFEAEVE